MTNEEKKQAIAKKVEDWDLNTLIEFAADRVYDDLRLIKNDELIDRMYREIVLGEEAS